jgi:outer membrane protein TolC
MTLVALGLALALPPAAIASPEASAGRPLTLDRAIAMALEKDDAITVERESVASAEAAVTGSRGAYDPILGVTGGFRQATDPVNSAFSGAVDDHLAPTIRTADAGTTFTQLFASGGTLSALASFSRVTSYGEFTLLSPAFSTEVGVEFRQPLLRNRKIDPARSGLRVAASDRRRAGASLRREVTEAIAAVERGYWTLIAARREIEVREEAVRLATEQLEETKIRVESGAAPETEIAQPKAELERRRGDLLTAREAASRADSTLKLLILGDSDDAWAEPLEPADDPIVQVQPVDVAASMRTALASRPELEDAAAVIERRHVESALASDTVHPSLDAVVSWNRFGLSGSANPAAIPFGGSPPVIPSGLEGGWGRSFDLLTENRFDDARAGFELRIPLGEHSARAGAVMARSAERQAEAGLSRARKDVRADVLNAAAALDTTGQRIDSTRAAREAAEIQLSAERDRYAAGLSTNFLVLTRQNDLSRARLDEIAARTDYRKALAEMARATGSLLRDHRIDVDGDANSSSSQEAGSHG